MHRLRTLLFVPGDRPDRIPKALASGADCAVVDLEDAVAATQKQQARAGTVAGLSGLRPDGVLAGVRLNALDTGLLEDDLAALAPVTQGGECLLQDVGRLRVAATLLHVGQVRLVRLDLRCRRRVVGVAARGQPALRTVPGLGDRCVEGEDDLGLVTVGAEVAHPLARRGLTSLGLTHGTGSDPTAADRVLPTYCHLGTPDLGTALVAVADLHEQPERDHGGAPDDAGADRDAVEVALGDRRPTEAAGHATSEHVGESAAPALVEQDQEDEEQAREDEQHGQCEDHGGTA